MVSDPLVPCSRVPSLSGVPAAVRGDGAAAGRARFQITFSRRAGPVRTSPWFGCTYTCAALGFSRAYRDTDPSSIPSCGAGVRASRATSRSLFLSGAR